MKTLLLFLSATVLFSSESMATDYNYRDAYCGYAAVIECTGGPEVIATYLSAGSPQYQGKCLTEAQAAQAFVKLSFAPKGSFYNRINNWCGKSVDTFTGKIRFIKNFETTRFGSGYVLAANFINTTYYAEEGKYYSTSKDENDSNLLNFVDLNADNPKLVRASTKNSGGATSGNVSQSKIGDAIYTGETKDGICEGSGTLSTANAVIKGKWKNNKPSGDMLVSYRNGSIYIGEYSIRPDRQNPGAFISSRTGNGVLISPDGTKKRGLWFDDLYVGQQTPQDEPARALDLMNVLHAILPSNIGDKGCDPAHNDFSTCKYQPDDHVLQDFGDKVVANNLDVNLKKTFGPGYSPLSMLVFSGRLSIYSKFSDSDETLKLLKISLGRYELYDGKNTSCEGDGCNGIETFESKLVYAAAYQCSDLLLDYFEMKGMDVTSDMAGISSLASAAANAFPVDSSEYRTCMQLSQRFKK